MRLGAKPPRIPDTESEFEMSSRLFTLRNAHGQRKEKLRGTKSRGTGQARQYRDSSERPGCECMRRVKVWRRGDYFDGLGRK